MTAGPSPFTRGSVFGAALIAAAGAALVAVSPVAFLALIALAVLMTAACRGLSGTERRAVAFVLLAAIALRVATILALFATARPEHLISFPFDGDGWFMKQRSIWIRNVWLGIPVDVDQFLAGFEAYGWTSYINVLAYAQYLLGPAPYAIHLVNVCCFIGSAVVLARIVRRAYGALASLIALTAIVAMPTLLMWSVSALKESLYMLLMTGVLAGLLGLARGRGALERLGGLILFAASAIALDSVRAGAAIIVGVGVGVAIVGTFVVKRPRVFLPAIVLVPIIVWAVLSVSVVRVRLMERIVTSASLHIGNVHTEGHGYKLLDQRFYSGDSLTSMTWPEAERFVVRSAVDFVVVPLPWQASSRSEVAFAPEQILWYGLVLLALVGAVEGSRSDVFVTWLFIGMSCAGAAAVAPNEGNIGTMVRHRDMIVPFVACLSGLGAVSLLRRSALWRRVAPDREIEQLFGGSALVAAFHRGLPWANSSLGAAASQIAAWPFQLRAYLVLAAIAAGAAAQATFALFAQYGWGATAFWTAAAVSCAVGAAAARVAAGTAPRAGRRSGDPAAGVC